MTDSIATEKPTTIDANQAFSQVNYGDSWRMARLGARNHAYSASDGYIQFDIKLTGMRRVIVKLNGKDYYDVEIGRIKKMDYIVLEQVRDIDAESLGRVIEDMAVRNS